MSCSETNCSSGPVALQATYHPSEPASSPVLLRQAAQEAAALAMIRLVELRDFLLGQGGVCGLGAYEYRLRSRELDNCLRFSPLLPEEPKTEQVFLPREPRSDQPHHLEMIVWFHQGLKFLKEHPHYQSGKQATQEGKPAPKEFKEVCVVINYLLRKYELWRTSEESTIAKFEGIERTSFAFYETSFLSLIKNQ